MVHQEIGRVLMNILTMLFRQLPQSSELWESYIPSVKLTTKDLGDKIQIAVKDKSPGIRKAIKDKILSAEGQGTTFTIQLPIQP